MAHPTERSSAGTTSGAGSPASTTRNVGPPGANQRVDHPVGPKTGSRPSASDMAEDAKQKMRDGAKQGQQRAAELGEEAKQQVCEATNQVKETTRQYAVEKKRQIAEELGAFSSAVQNAAKTLRDEEHGSVAHYVEAAAEQLDSARRVVENKSIGEFFDDVQDFTRRRPELVFGGLFVAGMAAMRFAKASRPTTSRQAMDGRSGQRNPALPARRTNVGPPPGFASTGEGHARPASNAGATYPSASPNQKP